MRGLRAIGTAGRGATTTRIAVGLVWIGGAIFNLLVTTRMDAPFAWLEESPLRPWRWFFAEVVAPHALLWTLLLVAWELAIGVLTLARGSRARTGLAGGVLFSLFLVTLQPAYTWMMAPYALLLGWLARHDHPASLVELVRGWWSRHHGTHHAAA